MTADQKDSSGGASTGSGNGERDVSEEESETHQYDPSKNSSQSERVWGEIDSQKAPSDDQLDVLEPQRYVTVTEDGQVAAQLNLKHLKKKSNSIFKLKNLHDNNTQPLSKSQWLPEAIRGSQPHILCCQGTGVRSFVKFGACTLRWENTTRKRLLATVDTSRVV